MPIFLHKIQPNKFLATINPDTPVWDKNVLSNLSIKTPGNWCKNRVKKIVETYSILENWYTDYIETQNAKDVIYLFDEVFPNTQVTNIKKIDLALWSMGQKN